MANKDPGSWLLRWLVLAVALLPGAVAQATTYYLDCSAGSDSNTGTTPSAPWLTLGYAAQTVYQPGDSLLLNAGTTCSGSISLSGSGTASAPITLGAYGTGAAPTLQNPGGAGAADYVIELHNQGGWVLNGLIVEGPVRYGVYVHADQAGTVFDGIDLSHLTVQGMGGRPDGGGSIGAVIVDSTASTASYSDVTIDSNTVTNVQQFEGILVRAAAGAPDQTVSVTNNSVSHIYGNGIRVWVADGVAVTGNVVWDTGNWESCPAALCASSNAIALISTTGAVVQGNEVFDTHSQSLTVDGCGLDVDVGNVGATVQYNYSHDNDNCGIEILAIASPNKDTTIRYNVFANNAVASEGNTPQANIHVSQKMSYALSGLEIYNNVATLSVTGIPAIDFKLEEAPTATLVANNIFYLSGSSTLMVVNDAGLAVSGLDDNLYFATAGAPTFGWGVANTVNLSGFQTLTGDELDAVVGDPLLVDAGYHAPGASSLTAFELQPGSPAIASGVAIDGGPATDFFGNPVPSMGPLNIGVDQAAPVQTSVSASIGTTGGSTTSGGATGVGTTGAGTTVGATGAGSTSTATSVAASSGTSGGATAAATTGGGPGGTTVGATTGPTSGATTTSGGSPSSGCSCSVGGNPLGSFMPLGVVLVALLRRRGLRRHR